MNTKEAIEVIENMLEALSKESLSGSGSYDADTVMMEIDVKKVIELLKRGEKFEKIPFIVGFDITVDEERKDLIRLIAERDWYKTILEKIKYRLNAPKAILINGEDILNQINDLQQRYFPKEE